MSEPNKSIVHRLEEAFASNDEATMRELCDPELTDHNPLPDQKPGLEGYLETVASTGRSFPTWRWAI
jgi:hypothetical protein